MKRLAVLLLFLASVCYATEWRKPGGTGGSTTPGGSDTQMQFNDNGSFGGDSGCTFNKTTNTLSCDVFVGALTGNVTGNCSGTAANITGMLALSKLTDDDTTAGKCLVSGGAGGDPNYQACPGGGVAVGGSITGSPANTCVLHEDSAQVDKLACDANTTTDNSGNMVAAASVKAPYFVTNAGDPADAGVFRMGNGDCIESEASPAGTDMSICSNAVEQWVFNDGSQNALVMNSTAATFWALITTAGPIQTTGAQPIWGRADGAQFILGASADVTLQRDAAAGPAFANNASATPTAYTLRIGSSSRAGTDTDVAGANGTIKPGNGTGTGGSGNLVLQTAPAGASGSTADTYNDRFVVVAKAKALTESSATTFVTLTIPSNKAGGANINYCIHGTDGTDFTERCGLLVVAALNKGGTATCTVSTVTSATEVVAVTAAATLTNTFTCANSSGNVLVQANAVCSLTQTVLEIRYSAAASGDVTITP